MLVWLRRNLFQTYHMISEVFLLNKYRVWNLWHGVCLRSFENTEAYLESYTYQPGFQLMTRMKVKKRENIKHVSLSAVPECADSLLVWVSQREFTDCDITATRKIGTAARRSLSSSHKCVIITKCYSKQSYVVHKEDAVNCNAMWINQRKYSGLSMFSYFCIFSTLLPCIIRILL